MYLCMAALFRKMSTSKNVTARLTYIYLFAILLMLSIQIDSVGLPSWQAQLSGTKMWTLTPPVECDNVCSSFNITVHRGDISEQVHVLKCRIIIIIIQHNKYVVNLHSPNCGKMWSAYICKKGGKLFKMNKEVGMLLQKRANTSGVEISNISTSLQHHPLTTPIHSNHTHRFHPLDTPTSC